MGKTQKSADETNKGARGLRGEGYPKLPPMDPAMKPTGGRAHESAFAGAPDAMTQKQSGNDQRDTQKFRRHVNSRTSVQLESGAPRQMRGA